MRVLLIEDDESIAEPLAEGLSRYGLAVDRVATGGAALAGPFGDIVLLDLGLPDMDGIDVCRRIRQVSHVPIIMLTARGEEADRVVGLEMGADDYLAKPFSMRELIARIRAVTRRTHVGAPHATLPVPAAPQGGHLYVPGTGVAGPAPRRPEALVVDRRTRQAWVGDDLVALTPKEFDLLALLAEDPGAVYSRQQILDQVWDPHFHGPTKTLDVHVAALRRKLGDPAWIHTVRGVGFRLFVPASRG
ncbi:response regulator transcription factor [Streptomyces albidochromogenes]|uniref:response regulator transcription factor n=1 Tax=Streptomyces albidochromogenes TaxID=329524 RepID=UPI00110FBE95|nr:response regulator transcription factor [Streptomyces albidochromogenes]